MKPMRLSFGEEWLEIQCWESMDAMFDFLTRFRDRYVWLGESAEHPAAYYTVTVASATAGAEEFAIGICSEGYALSPNLLLNPGAGTLLFGFNSEVVGITPPHPSVRFRILCDAVFFQFVWLADAKTILVFHEIGVVAISEDGDEIWRYSKDIVTDWSVEQGRLHLEFMDSPPIDLMIETGSPPA